MQDECAISDAQVGPPKLLGAAVSFLLKDKPTLAIISGRWYIASWQRAYLNQSQLRPQCPCPYQRHSWRRSRFRATSLHLPTPALWHARETLLSNNRQKLPSLPRRLPLLLLPLTGSSICSTRPPEVSPDSHGRFGYYSQAIAKTYVLTGLYVKCKNRNRVVGRRAAGAQASCTGKVP